MKKLIAPLVLSIFFIIGIPYICLAQEEGEVKEKEPKKKAEIKEEVILPERAVLLRGGTFLIEPSFQYSHFSKYRLSISGFTLFEAIIIGRIESEKIRRDILVPSLSVRAGITDWLNVEIKAPWMYRRDQEITGALGAREERKVDDSGWGDIEGAIYIHLIREKGAIPDIIFNLKGKSKTGKDPYGLAIDEQNRPTELPTGSGHWGVSGGLTFIKTSDPVVLFATAGYFYNIKRKVGEQGGRDYGKIDPGDSFEYNLGMALALSEKLSTSLYFLQRFTSKTKQNGVGMIETDVNVASLFTGLSYSLSEKTAISFLVGIGITEDSPNLEVALKMPVQF